MRRYEKERRCVKARPSGCWTETEPRVMGAHRERGERCVTAERCVTGACSHATTNQTC
jgi:hypothetical protein